LKQLSKMSTQVGFGGIGFFIFGFESTQLARQLHQERTQMKAQ